MKIQYYLVDGSELVYDTPSDVLSLSDFNEIIGIYVKLRPNILPTTVFINVRLYMPFFTTTMMYGAPLSGPDIYLSTCVGPLKVQILPMMSDAKMLVIGRNDDFERYDIDKVFEQTVLKDCDKI